MNFTTVELVEFRVDVIKNLFQTYAVLCGSLREQQHLLYQAFSAMIAALPENGRDVAELTHFSHLCGGN